MAFSRWACGNFVTFRLCTNQRGKETSVPDRRFEKR